MKPTNRISILKLCQAKRTPFLCLLFLLLGSAFFLKTTFSISEASNEDLISSKITVEHLESVKTTLKNQLGEERSAENKVQQFLLSWSPYVGGQITHMHILEKIDEKARNLGVEIIDKTAVQEKTASGDIYSVKIVLTGQLKQLIRWLGKIEETYPLLRVNALNITEKANILNMDIEFSYPIIK